MTPNGEIVWSHVMGGGEGGRVAIHGDDIYVTAEYDGNTPWRSGACTIEGIKESGVLAKLKADGSCVWAKATGGTYVAANANHVYTA